MCVRKRVDFPGVLFVQKIPKKRWVCTIGDAIRQDTFYSVVEKGRIYLLLLIPMICSSCKQIVDSKAKRSG
jgi:hypothetical protein